MNMNYTTTAPTTLSTTIDPLLHNMSCQVPHYDHDKIYTYRLTSSFTAVSTLVAVFNFLFMLPTTIGNLVIIIGFIRNKQLLTIPNKFLLTLCCVDFITGVIIEPIFGAHIVQVTRASHQCGLSNFLLYIVPSTILITMVTHAAISVERFCSIRYAKSYSKIFGPRFVNGFTIFIWLASVLCFVIPMISGKVIIGTNITVGLIFVSLAVCSYCYISIYQDSKQQHVRTTAKIKGAYVIRKETPVNRSPDQQEQFQADMRTAMFFSKLFLCMVIIYILALIKNTLNAYDVFPGNGYYTMHFVFETILFMNALLNPALILCMDRQIYDAAMTVL